MEIDQNNKVNFLKPRGQKNSGMKVPDGYFENLENAVFTSIQETDHKVVNLNNSWIIKSVAIVAVAASLIWAAFWVLNPSIENIHNTNSIAEITIEDFEYYDDVDDYLLADNFTETELEGLDLSNDFLTADEIYEYIKNEDISEYLLTENF